MISILTPTVRKDRLEIVKQSLENQTYTDFEWLIGSPFDPECGTWVVDDFTGGYWSLNRIYNKLIKQAKGDLLISLQDSIYIPPNGVEKFVMNFEATGGIISGVGDQYDRLDEYGKPYNKVWADPRKTNHYDTFYQCNANDCEWNWAAFPKEAMLDVGGMDEELDFLGFGGDQLQVCERLDALGYPFYLDQTNESFTYRHGRVKGWDENHVLFNGKYDERKRQLMQEKKWPRLTYLSN